MNLKSFAVNTLAALALITGVVAMTPNSKAEEFSVEARPEVDCKRAFEIRCYRGGPLVVLPGEIADMPDTTRFCKAHKNYCFPWECSGRLNVLFGFVAPSKILPCLPALKQ